MAVSLAGDGRRRGMNDQEDPCVAELRRLYRVADQMVSMHSRLHDEYRSRAVSLLLTAVVISILMMIFVLVDQPFMSRTAGIGTDSLRWTLAVAAFCNFLFVVLDLVLRPGAIAEAHDAAAQHFLRAKNRLRELQATAEGVSSETVNTIRERFFEDPDLIRIPEKKFLKMKQWHLMKVAVSKALDKDPGQSVGRLRRELHKSRRSD